MHAFDLTSARYPAMHQTWGTMAACTLRRGCTIDDLASGMQVLVLRISRKRRSTSSDRECVTPGNDSANSRLQQITEARIGLQFLHPNIVHVYAYAARVINMDTIMAKVSSPFPCMFLCKELSSPC